MAGIDLKVEPSGGLNKRNFKEDLNKITIENICKKGINFLVEAIYDEDQFKKDEFESNQFEGLKKQSFKKRLQ